MTDKLFSPVLKSHHSSAASMKQDEHKSHLSNQNLSTVPPDAITPPEMIRVEESTVEKVAKEVVIDTGIPERVTRTADGGARPSKYKSDLIVGQVVHITSDESTENQ